MGMFHNYEIVKVPYYTYDLTGFIIQGKIRPTNFLQLCILTVDEICIQSIDWIELNFGLMY